jgi:hypothetical protein
LPRLSNYHASGRVTSSTCTSTPSPNIDISGGRCQMTSIATSNAAISKTECASHPFQEQTATCASNADRAGRPRPVNLHIGRRPGIVICTTANKPHAHLRTSYGIAWEGHKENRAENDPGHGKVASFNCAAETTTRAACRSWRRPRAGLPLTSLRSNPDPFMTVSIIIQANAQLS